MKYADEVENIFKRLVDELRGVLPDFGKHLSIDSKAISSFAKQKNKKQTLDGRRDIDADYGRKEYKEKTKDSKLWKNIVKWFGYKLHLVVDAVYELPMAFKVTKASASDITEGHAMLSQIEQEQPEILKKPRHWRGTGLMTTQSLLKSAGINIKSNQ